MAYSESSMLADDDVVADLVAHREDLRIIMHELEVEVPTVIPSLVGLQASVLLFLGAVALLLAPYVETTLPSWLSTIAAFLLVVLAFTSYLALRRFSMDFERRRLYRVVLKRASYLSDTADTLLVNLGFADSKAVRQ